MMMMMLFPAGGPVGGRPSSRALPSSSCRPLLTLLVLSVLLASPSLHSTSTGPGGGGLRARLGPLALAQQNGGGQDGGQDGQEHQESPVDPSLVNPTNRQGYGRDVPLQIIKTEPMNRSAKTDKTKSMAEQTTQAALQLGVLVGVSLLVGVIFFVNIGIELLINHICDKVSDFFGRKREEDIEEQDPASLVGTFKRYK